MIVLDTNVISEVVKSSPNAAVMDWLKSQPQSSVFTTTICEAEILYGLALLPKGRRRTTLQSAVDGILREALREHILPFDSAAAAVYPELIVSRRAAGRPISQADAQIAAIVVAHGAALATRNATDFEQCRIRVINPWIQK